MILDLQLPGMDGLSLCTEIRRDRRTKDVPVVMLTARGDEADRIVGLEMGADDYVVKPFSPKELVARVRALFRRLERTPEDETPLVRGPLEVDRLRHVVRYEGQPVHLTAKEFALLVALLEAKGRVLSRQALLEDVWGYSYSEGTRTVDVHVRRLREKIPGLAPRDRHGKVTRIPSARATRRTDVAAHAHGGHGGGRGGGGPRRLPPPRRARAAPPAPSSSRRRRSSPRPG